jgi:hypothetical protein
VLSRPPGVPTSWLAAGRYKWPVQFAGFSLSAWGGGPCNLGTTGTRWRRGRNREPGRFGRGTRKPAPLHSMPGAAAGADCWAAGGRGEARGGEERRGEGRRGRRQIGTQTRTSGRHICICMLLAVRRPVVVARFLDHPSGSTVTGQQCTSSVQSRGRDDQCTPELFPRCSVTRPPLPDLPCPRLATPHRRPAQHRHCGSSQ